MDKDSPQEEYRTVLPAANPKQPVVKVENAKKLPSGAKAHLDFEPLAARLNSCPFKT
jgi:hypothetical protein